MFKQIWGVALPLVFGWCSLGLEGRFFFGPPSGVVVVDLLTSDALSPR